MGAVIFLAFFLTALLAPLAGGLPAGSLAQEAVTALSSLVESVVNRAG